MADDIAVGTVAEYQSERIDQDRFARAGFARQRGEAGVELQISLLDDGEITNMDVGEHVISTGIVHRRGAASFMA